MKVILQVDVHSLGREGEVVEVKDGFARNFLLPHKKAVEATPLNLKRLEEESQHHQEKTSKTKKQAEILAQKLEAVSCTLSRQAGETEKLFGSVTPMDIEKYLKEEGFEIDRKKILLKEPIKSLGVYSVPLKLHPEVTTHLKVWVVKE